MSEPRPTAKDIKEMLRREHAGKNFSGEKWAFFEEFRLPGFALGVRSLDAWAINVWPSSNFAKVAYEIKVSRSDFLRELKEPIKRREALLMSNSFFFVAPRGLIKPEELPIECGLIEVAWDEQKAYRGMGAGNVAVWEPGWRSKTTVSAPWHDSAPTWALVAGVARRIARLEREEAVS